MTNAYLIAKLEALEARNRLSMPASPISKGAKQMNLPVIQADRDAAWPTRPSFYLPADKANWDKGVYDKNQHVQAFAAHRLAQIAALETPTPKLIEAVCQARLYSDHPDVRWNDGLTDGVANIERMIAERILTAAAAHLKGKNDDR